MINRIALLTAISLTSINSFAEVSQTEQAVVQAANKRTQEIALARVPIESKYLSTLQAAYKKAESAKDLELQVKIKKEIDIVEGNIAYFKAKSTEDVNSATRNISEIKWVHESNAGSWCQFNLRNKTVKSNAGTETFTKNGETFVAAGGWSMTPSPDGDYLTNNSGVKYYPAGKKAKGDAPKAPEGEEVNTVFGRRVK